jgi:hypothetical protein
VFIRHIEQNLGYGRQDEAMLPSWPIQDGVGSGQATVVFTEVSEKAVIRNYPPQPGYVCYDKRAGSMLYKADFRDT